MLKKLIYSLFHGKRREKETAPVQRTESNHAAQAPVNPEFTIQADCLVGWSGNEEVLRVPAGVKAVRLALAYGQKCKLRQVILPQGLKEIGARSFSGCSALESVDIPDTVERIGEHAFVECFMLRSIRLPAALKEIGAGAFIGCSRLPELVWPEGLKKIGEFAFSRVSMPETVVIPAWIERIEQNTFAACRGMKRVVIPANLSSIGKQAFIRCEDLETVVFEADGKEQTALQIGEQAFEMTGLTRIELPERLIQLSASVFFGCKKLAYASLPGHMATIPESTFYACRALQQVDGLCNIEHIEESAFHDCESLPQLPPMEKLRQIGKLAFAQCHQLREVSLHDRVERIGEQAFARCTSLVKVTLPDNMTLLGEHAFENCRDLETVSYAFVDENEEAFTNTPFWRRRKQLPQIPDKLPDQIYGDISGKKLREMGYSFFSSNRDYFISKPNEAGVVHVSSFREEDGMDEYGFGRELYYDHWLMDERLEPIPGVKVFACMSSHDMRDHEAEWQAEWDKAAYRLRCREGE